MRHANCIMKHRDWISDCTRPVSLKSCKKSEKAKMTMTAKQEWAANWQLPLLAMLGIAGAATFGYSSGVFMEQMTREFGWSRAQFSAAFTVQMVLGLIVMPFLGRLVDRIGPRRIGLAGIGLYTLAFSALGLANGTIWQWWLLGAVQAVGVAFITNPVWLSSVIPRFHASRGLALAVSLAGIGVATLIWPNIAAFGIQHLGWRLTFPAMAVLWAVIMLPFAWFCLVDPPAIEVPAETAEATAPKSDYLRALRSRTAICLALAGGIFASVTYGIILNLVPMLQTQGMTLTAAAGLTSIMGIFVIGGRIATGYLLDRLPTLPLSIAVFALPVIVCLVLWVFPGNSIAIMVAVALLGLATGSETDVVVYMIAQRFGRDIFATVLAVIMSVFALLAATGPLLAGSIFDQYDSYEPYLMIGIPLALFATLCIALVPDRPVADAAVTV